MTTTHLIDLLEAATLIHDAKRVDMILDLLSRRPQNAATNARVLDLLLTFDENH